MKNIFWTAYTNQERHEAITATQNVISKFGSITDFKPFSDISLSIIVEIEARKLTDLYKALKEIISIDDHEKLHSDSTKEVNLYLNITFTKATGKLRTEIPAVPG